MILLVDMCYRKGSLSYHEFVRPIESMVSGRHDCRTIHRTDLCEGALDPCDKVILCGTALHDYDYLLDAERFECLKDVGRPVLGICAGMQALSLIYGGGVYRWNGIGLNKIDIVNDSALLGHPRSIEGYQLHNYGVEVPEGFLSLAMEGENTVAFSSEEKGVYGIIFHPEVRNRWIVENFLKL